MNNDLISRQAAQDYMAKYLSQFLYDDVREAVETIDAYIGDLPSITPTERTGHWIEHPEIETSTPEYLMFYECSECGDKQCFCKPDIHKKRFCSNCGCRMVEPQESEDEE